MTPTSRREADRLAYHDHQRAAQAMRVDAEGFRAIAAEAANKPNPDVYGKRAQDYAEGLAARYAVLAAFCDHEASKQQAYADDYFAHVTCEQAS